MAARPIRGDRYTNELGLPKSSIPQRPGGPGAEDVARHQRAQGSILAGARDEIHRSRDARAQSQLAHNIAGREDLFPQNGAITRSRLAYAAQLRQQYVSQKAAGPHYGGL